MIEPSILSWGLSVVCGVMGWFLRELWNAVKDLEETVSALKDKVNTDFVRKEDVRDFRNEVINHLVRIESKLDNKADKL